MESNSLHELFTEYEKAFAALDIKKSAGFFSDTFISAGPRGAITQSKAEFLKLADQAAEFYKRVGQISAKILSLQETTVSDEYSMVRVHWGGSPSKKQEIILLNLMYRTLSRRSDRNQKLSCLSHTKMRRRL